MARTDEELLKALADFRADPLDPDLPDDLLDEMVRAEGGDPIAIARSALAAVEAQIEQERLAWQESARRNRDRLEQKTRGGRRDRQAMSADEMLAEIEALKSNPKLAQPIALAARKRQPGVKPDAEELRMLLEDLDELQAISADEGDDGER